MTSADECPHCGVRVPATRTVTAADGAVTRERATCRSCALQVVRRLGEPWEGIRG